MSQYKCEYKNFINKSANNLARVDLLVESQVWSSSTSILLAEWKYE